MALPKHIRAEFARRAVQFHPTELLENINLWGLFSWGTVSKYIKRGEIIPNEGYTKENETIWCKPNTIEINEIKKFIQNNSLDELTFMAGW